MNYKSITMGFLILCGFVISFAALFLMGNKVEMILLFVLIALSFGLVINIANGFLIPSKWFFNNRFWISGAFWGILISINIRILDNDRNFVFDVNMLLISFLISIITGILIIGTFSFQRFRKLKKKTQFTKRALETEILSDSAVLLCENDYTKRGRLILTNKRLCFVSANDEKKVTDFEFANIKSDIQLINRLYVPNKILIQDSKTEIIVAFPSLWKHEIEKITCLFNNKLDVLKQI